MIEIFKTNIKEVIETEAITQILLKHFPNIKVDFDLEDVDKVMRIEGNSFNKNQIIKLVVSRNYYCEILK